MTTTAAELVTKARTLSSLTRRQLALLAGVAPSTVTRVADPDALRAARIALDPLSGIHLTSPATDWLARWERIGLVNGTEVMDIEGLAFRAGNLARLAHRRGARRFTMPDGGWRQLARSLRSSTQAWAITGSIAALRYTPIANAVWPVCYVEDVSEAASIAGLEVAARPGTGVTLIPFDDVTSTGVERAAGACWAAPWQVVLDCFGGTGRMPDQAEDMLRRNVNWQAAADAG